MVQGAAADRVAHPRDRSIAWGETEGGSSSRPGVLLPDSAREDPSPEQSCRIDCPLLVELRRHPH